MAVTPYYLRPATGATAPTASKVQRLSTLVAVLAAVANLDTQVTITHDFGLPNSDITQGFPSVSLLPLDPSAFTSNWYLFSQNPNYTVLEKSSGGVLAGSQLLVTISRPNTLVR
jgi:hypothetical protein